MMGKRYFLPLRMKFLIVFVLLITVPYFVSGVFTYRKYSSDVDRNTRDSTLKIMEQMNLNLDRYVKEIDRLTQAPLYDQDVLGILLRHSGSYDPNLYLPIEEYGKINLFLSSIISLIAAFGIAVLISNRLVKPIRRLQSHMKQVQRGSFQSKAVVVTHDEIGQLTVTFNTMVDELNRLVREVYETRIREREAELSALQSQINPHFLYNTLESVNMLALHNEQLQISDIVSSLGKLLRYTVEKQERPVTLRDELLFVDNYLQIQAFRLKNRLHAVIDIEPSFEDCLVPKLILQPLIENVIEHALKKETVTIKITANFQNDDLVISVTDNGIGLTRQQIEDIEMRINSRTAAQYGQHRFGEENKGFGLRNVHQRLKILYGDNYGLFIDKEVNEGSSFMLKLPV